MKSENLFYSFQSGFRSSFSTDTCLTRLTDQIRFQMDRGCYTEIGLYGNPGENKALSYHKISRNKSP